MKDSQDKKYTCFHWGTYRIQTYNDKLVALHPFSQDSDPSPIAASYIDVLDDDLRIRTPMVRKSWLEHGPGRTSGKRGQDEFIPVSWDEAEQIVVKELRRIINDYGNESIFAGSYGWASAGRFHHAQGHLKRFLNLIGGFTKSVNTYSLAAGEVIMPHMLGSVKYIYGATHWQSVIDNCELFVAFGGLPVSNSQISQGGVGRHCCKPALLAARAAGVEFVNLSPLRSDAIDELNAEFLPLRPSTDTALMLALAWVLLNENLHDKNFLNRYTVGFERFSAYLTGETDGVKKDPQWAAKICDLPAEQIAKLARRMAESRTMISLSWSLTRQDHGEQTFWAGTTLAAMLGQIGLPGSGVGFGYAATNTAGLQRRQVRFQPFPQGVNPVKTFIPVARVTELLENPNGEFHYNGQIYRYPDTQLIWWAGGNPFHHHQDLNRLKKAWEKPQTVIVNEWCWNPIAKHADIILPCTTPLERDDINLSPRDPYLVFMSKAIEPVGQARDDYEIFRNLARHMGIEEPYSKDRQTMDWLEWLYEQSKQQAHHFGIELPAFDKLKKNGWHKLSVPVQPEIMLADFRADPDANPLKTPSGKIEIYSTTIDQFNLEDCPGHPSWMEPLEWLGSELSDRYPFHLISNQPHNKLHAQLDHGSLSQADRKKGHEPVWLHPIDALNCGIADGDIVRVYNQRGACLCEAKLTDQIRKNVIKISTGAWFDPDNESRLCRAGNPNVLTPDKGTSQLAQGPIAHSCLVAVEPWSEEN